MLEIFYKQTVKQYSTSQAQHQWAGLCCFQLKIPLWARLEGDLYAVKFQITDATQASLKEMTVWEFLVFVSLLSSVIKIVLLLDPGHEVWCLNPLTGNTGPKWRSMTLSLPGLTSPHPSLPRYVCDYVLNCVQFTVVKKGKKKKSNVSFEGNKCSALQTNHCPPLLNLMNPALVFCNIVIIYFAISWQQLGSTIWFDLNALWLKDLMGL